MSHLKRTLILIIVIFAVALSSCQSAKGSFRVYKEGDDWYFEVVKPEYFNWRSSSDYPHFSSLEGLTNALLKNDFSDIQKGSISNFVRDAGGEKFELFNIDCLYDVTFPGSDEYEGYVVWSHKTYSWQFFEETGDRYGTRRRVWIYPPQQEISQTHFQEIYVSFMDWDEFDGPSTMLSERKIEYRNATEYIYQHFGSNMIHRDIKYTLSDGEKTVYVVEAYGRYEHEEAGTWSKGGVSFFVEEGDLFYHGTVLRYEDFDADDKCPTEEWFLSIELEPFVPEDVA